MDFSKHLLRYYHTKSVHDAIKKMKSCTSDKWVMNDMHIVTDGVIQKGEFFTNSKYIQNMQLKDSHRDVIIWINKSIISNLDTDTYITTGVKLRIATGMLFKNCGEDATLMHLALLHNVNEIKAALIDEELPF